MSDEPRPFTCPDPEIRVALQQIRSELQGHTKALYKLDIKADATNGRLTKLEADSLILKGRDEERERWERKSAAGTRWLIATSVAAAGVLSGIVFGTIQLAFSAADVNEIVTIESTATPQALHPESLCDIPPCRGHQMLGGEN